MKCNFIKSALAILTVICMVTAFAACVSRETENSASTTHPSEASQTNSGDSEFVQPTVQANGSAENSDPQQGNDGQTSQSSGDSTSMTNLPAADTAEFARIFNTALKNSSLKCTSSQQKVETGKLWLGNKSDETMDLRAPEQAELLAKFEKTEAAGISLPNLSANNIESVSVSENVVVYKLKSCNASDAIEQGQGGYINIIDTDGTKGLVEGVKSYANINGTVKISSSKYKLSEGLLTVKFNNDKYEKITSVNFSAKQNVRAEMKYIILTINADIAYKLASNYSAL